MTMQLVGMGLGAAAGGTAAGLGVGKDKHNYQGFGQSGQYNSGASGYNETNQGREWGAQGLGGQKRVGEQLDNTLGDQSRGSQADALAMMREAAMGNVPSVAQLQMKSGMDEGLRNQQALAASARGPAALAMAQYGAGANTAGIQQATNAQAGQLRAQEMAQALGQYGGMGSTMRGMDEGRAVTQAELNARQRAQNDQYQLGMIGAQNQANSAALAARMQEQNMLAGSYNQAQALNAGVNQANAVNEWKYYNAMMGGMQGGGQGGGLGGGGKAGADAGGYAGAGVTGGGVGGGPL
jgi:hypothetical protein